MNSSGLFAIYVIHHLVEADGKAVEDEGPGGSGSVEGFLHAEDDGCYGVSEVSYDGDGIGSKCFWDSLGDEFSDRTPESVVGNGNVVSFVLVGSNLLISLF